MSADNYIYVNKRADGKYTVDMRFASTYYADEDQAFALPESAVSPTPKPYKVCGTATQAVASAHLWYQDEDLVEYGVCLNSAVLKDLQTEAEGKWQT